MVQCNLGYKENGADIAAVEPGLAVSIAEALTTGVIKDTATSTPYTQETDINAVGHYITDKIEGAMYAKAIGASIASAPTSSEIKE